jgi:hypothetical protein
VGSCVGEMAGEVGDSIWPLAKEEAHERVVSTGAQLNQRGTMVRGGGQWWRSAAHGSGRWSGHGRSLGEASTERVGGRGRLVPMTPSWQKWTAAQLRVARG